MKRVRQVLSAVLCLFSTSSLAADPVRKAPPKAPAGATRPAPVRRQAPAVNRAKARASGDPHVDGAAAAEEDPVGTRPSSRRR